jgi:hypothetical protein
MKLSERPNMNDQPVNKFTPTVNLNPEPIDCFFTLDCGCNWCPGWVIGEVTLPLSIYSNMFRLIYDSGGGTHWIHANKVKYRGECHIFEYAYYKTFDWQKWRTFPKVD